MTFIDIESVREALRESVLQAARGLPYPAQVKEIREGMEGKDLWSKKAVDSAVEDLFRRGVLSRRENGKGGDFSPVYWEYWPAERGEPGRGLDPL